MRCFVNNPAVEQVVKWLAGSDLQGSRRKLAIKEFGTTDSTLRRHLMRAGTNWTILLDRERRKRSDCLLANGVLCVDTLTVETGFVERNSYYFAFRRWYGKTFREYKASLKVNRAA